MDGGDQAEAKEVVPAASAAVVGEKYCGDGERELTVRRTSLFSPGDGYAAYSHGTGELVFRVETYGRGPSLADSLVLMDPFGTPILTVRRKWPSLHHRWEGFLGDKKEGQKPLFSVKRSSIFGDDRHIIDVETHDGSDREYRIEGSFAQRSCRVLMYDQLRDPEAGNEELVLAEIKRKVDACSHVDVVLSKDVFCLCLKPRFDAAFAMGLVLVLDQITGDDDDTRTRDIDAASVAPSDDDDHQNNSS